jgi:trk/ktr system potassium uptake protein
MPGARPAPARHRRIGSVNKVHVVVVGCGRVGSELAGALELGGHTVAVVDKRKEAFRRLPPSFSGKTVVGFGFDRDTLLEGQVDQAGAFAAVTSGDNSNIMAARVARETFEIERVVARIYDPRRAAIYQRLGIPTVATVAWTTDQVLRRLLPGDHAASWTDSSGNVALVERDLPATWAGRPLSQLEAPGRCKLVSVTRLGTARVFESDLVGQEGDILHLIVATDSLEALQERLDETSDIGGHH